MNLSLTRWSQKVKQKRIEFYEVVFDSSLSDYTYFDEPMIENGDVIDWWHFSGSGRWEGKEPLKVTASPIGKLYDVSMAPGDVPYVTKKVADIFNAEKVLADAVQFIPLKYGVNTIYIMNILPVIACVDEEKTESIMRWQEEDGEPEKIGKYRQIIGLRVDPERLKHIDICRVKDWEVSIIVSQRVKLILDAHHVNGIVFWPA
jgi:hypothetical protein